MDAQYHKIKHGRVIEVFNLAPENKDPARLQEICDDYLKNRFFLGDRYPIVELPEERIWDSNPLNDRSWNFTLHCLIPIDCLLNGYKKIGKIEYLAKSLELLGDWKKHNFTASEYDMAWHDHSTALRLIIICRLFETWRQDHWDPSTYQEFAELAKYHCETLSDPQFYRAKHNHGLDQDIALYVAGTIFHQLSGADDWRRLALNRFWAQVRHLQADDGSYLEHSPSYTFLFIHRLLQFVHFLKQQRNNEHVKLKNVVEKQIVFLTHILQPDGKTPNLGDSETVSLNFNWINPPQRAMEYLQYVTSAGRMGRALDEMDAIYPIGGYAVSRNQWHYDENTVQVVFYSSFHSRVHKHHDDLSVTVFGHNQPLLIDSGKFNFDYNDPNRQYIISNRAHNTVAVDDMNTDLKKLNIGKSRLTHYYADRNFTFAGGVHFLYPRIMHRRIVMYLKPWDILILDQLHGYKEHKFEQTFNFHPNVECKLKDKILTGTINQTAESIALTPLIHGDRLNVSLFRGNKNPLRGWCSLEYGKMLANSSCSYILSGCDAQFATHINLQPSVKLLDFFNWRENMIELAWKNQQFKISIENWHLSITLNHQLHPVKVIENPFQ